MDFVKHVALASAGLITLAACDSTNHQTDNETTGNSAPAAAISDPVLARGELVSDREARYLQMSAIPDDAAAEDFLIRRADGREIAVERIDRISNTELRLVPAENLDIARVHHVEHAHWNTRAHLRFDGWFRDLYSDKALGAEIAADGGSTDIRVFAPRAHDVTLHLYSTADGPSFAEHDLTRDDQGVWEIGLPGDLHGTWYDFVVTGPNDPGDRFYDTHPVHLSDPYARVNDDAQGRSRIWRATTPATPLAGGRPPLEDVIAYEVHLQDFTDLLPVGDRLTGRIPAMIQPGLVNDRGEAIGFDYLVDLGVNVVHLMPMQEYLHYPDAEWQAAFAEDPDMQAMGIAEENYQWGYRTTHAFAVETRFRQIGTEQGAERDQFRDLVQAFHDQGMAVIIDIVPNHTGENMDGRDMPFNFSGFARHYYYRLDEEGRHIGAFGNEVKTEDRLMVQRWLIDQCRHWIEEFGIDGFRIDLAGQIDEQTLIRLREELGEDVIIYGEPWIDVNDPFIRSNPEWDWYKEDAPITFFQDDARNALVGSPFVLEDPATDRGYAGGNTRLRADAIRAIANDYAEESESTLQGINYMDIHDNWTLADRFALTDWDGRRGVDEAPYRISAGLLLTSMGPIVLHGGSEIMRSKGAAPIAESVVETESGQIHLKGRDDTYNVRTPNQFVWSDVGASADEAPSDYAAMQAWWRGLIRFRLSEAGAVFRRADVPEGHLRFFTPDDEALLAYTAGDSVLVLVNVGEQDARMELADLPQGRWTQIADGSQVDPSGITSRDAGDGFDLPALSLQIWVRDSA